MVSWRGLVTWRLSEQFNINNFKRNFSYNDTMNKPEEVENALHSIDPLKYSGQMKPQWADTYEANGEYKK